MSCSSSKRLFQAARQTNWLQHTNGDSCTRCRKKTAATWIAFQRLGGVFNSRVVVAEAQLALSKVEMEWYFHRVESYKVFVARFLPARSSRNVCTLQTHNPGRPTSVSDCRSSASLSTSGVFQPFQWNGTVWSIQTDRRIACSDTRVGFIPNAMKHHFPVLGYVQKTPIYTDVCV